MRRILLLVLLTALPAGQSRAEDPLACTGEIWRKVEAWIEPETRFEDAVAFLRGQSIHYTVLDARAKSLAVNGEFTINPEPYDAVDCQPSPEPPNCSLAFSEPLPENEPTFASSPNLANVVRARELLSIDFDAEEKLIGYECRVVRTGP